MRGALQMTATCSGPGTPPRVAAQLVRQAASSGQPVDPDLRRGRQLLHVVPQRDRLDLVADGRVGLATPTC
jgi:hypothetical protein